MRDDVLVRLEALQALVEPVDGGVGHVRLGQRARVRSVVVGVRHHQEEIVVDAEELPVGRPRRLQRGLTCTTSQISLGEKPWDFSLDENSPFAPATN